LINDVNSSSWIELQREWLDLVKTWRTASNDALAFLPLKSGLAMRPERMAVWDQLVATEQSAMKARDDFMDRFRRIDPTVPTLNIIGD
jgi:hypothetical protein